MTLWPSIPVVSRRIPPSSPIDPSVPSAGNERERGPRPRIPALDIEDIPPAIGDRLNDVRLEPIAEDSRDPRERLRPPPREYGMKPPKLPAYGMIAAPRLMPAMAAVDVAP
jgi:hypothetical protein